MSEDRPKFMSQAKGGKIGKLTINNVTVTGDCDFMNMAGEIEEANISNTRHIVPPRIKKLVSAIKKPTANDNAGWKIMIVGSLLALGIAIFTVHYSGWFESYKEQTQTSSQEQSP